jgi:lipopolysaccharide transport system permease protein
LNFVLDPFRAIWRHRSILFGTLMLEMRSTYAGSVLGISWIVLAPMLLMVIYAAVYLLIFRVSLPGLRPVDYVFLTSTGLAAYTTFGNSLAAGTNSVLRNKQVLVNAVFPAELLPVRAVLTACPALVFGMAALMILAPIFGQGGWKLLFVPVLVVFQIMFMCGIAWVLSLLTILIRDIQHILQYVTTVLLIITPIGYTVEMVPAALAPVVRLNPLAHYVLAYQSLIVFDRWPSPWHLGAITVLALTAFLAGFWVFQKAKFAFYDYA